MQTISHKEKQFLISRNFDAMQHFIFRYVKLRFYSAESQPCA